MVAEDALRQQLTSRDTYAIIRTIQEKEVIPLRTERIVIQLPMALKRKLDALRSQGYAAAGYIRSLLERELNRERVKNKRGDP